MRDHLPRLLALAAAGLTILLALHQIRISREYGPYIEMEALFARRQPVSPSALVLYAERLDRPLKTCRSDIVEAVIKVSQRHVDRQFAEHGAAAWRNAMQRMEKLVRNALKCSPTNGDLWARLAVLRWFLGGSANEQVALMELSQSYAPADLAVIRRRLRHWSGVTNAMAALGERIVRSDLRTLLLHAPERDVIRIFGWLSPDLQRVAGEEMIVVPPERMAALHDAGMPPLPP